MIRDMEVPAMKKWMTFLSAALVMVSLTACGNGAENGSLPEAVSTDAQTEEAGTSASEETVVEEAASDEAAGEASDTGRLVAYFSYAENAALPDGADASASASIQGWNGETTGNTGVVAAMIAEAAGADLFSIRTVEKYPDSYDATIE